MHTEPSNHSRVQRLINHSPPAQYPISQATADSRGHGMILSVDNSGDMNPIFYDLFLRAGVR
jgi:hypothetical protein